MTKTISPNSTIAQYTIVSKLGEGGMGEVWRARDNRLGRDVAIKVLPASLSADKDRLARFEQEAQAASALNHPNILVIHHIDTHDGAPYIVSELLDGQTLRDRMNGGAMAQRKAVDYALQIAKGLAAAHEKGIVHRDLKPENIFVTDDGRVKILDFGLAKLTAAADGTQPQTEVPTRKVNTDPGTVMGTMGYMSPEQLKGKHVDHRSDIFSFGAILYEMLSGKRAFRADSMAETMSAILREEPPDLSETNKTVSPALERVVRHCLEKNPAQRFHSASDLSFAIEALSGAPTSSGETASQTFSTVPVLRGETPGAKRFWMYSAVALAALLLSLGLFVAFRLSPRNESAPLVRYDVSALDKMRLSLLRYPPVAVSPDGSTLVFLANSEGISRLYLRKRDDTEIRAIPDTEGALDAAFSADGQWIAFMAADYNLKKVPLNGPVVSLTKVGDPRGLCWLGNETIVFTPQSTGGVFQIPASGGTPSPITTVAEKNKERTHRWPQVLPGGKAVIFTVGTVDKPDDYDGANIEAVLLATGERRQILQGASIARYVPTGHLVFARDGVLYAVDFDVDRLNIKGKPVPILNGVAGDKTTGAVHFSIADDGTLAYVPGSITSGIRGFVWIDKNGTMIPVDIPLGQLNDPRISPDASRVALIQGSSSSGDVWIFDLTRSTLTRFTFTGTNATPVWSHDGKYIYYVSNSFVPDSTSVLRKRADGSQDAEEVVKLEGIGYLKAILPDGKSAILDYQPHTNSADIIRIELSQGAQKAGLVDSKFNEFAAAVSPDGRWMAYQSNESGRPEIYVRNLETGSRTQISTASGQEPHWAPDGRGLYYRNANFLNFVPIQTGATLQAGTAKTLVTDIFDLRSNSGVTFDVNRPDGRILMIRPPKDQSATTIKVVLNWFAELRRLATTK